MHFVDDFAFDHKAEHWAGIDVDRIFRRYYEDSVALAESGLFDGIGHPDTIKLFGHKPSYALTGYYEDLAIYTKIIAQRNTLLKEGTADPSHQY